METLPDTLKTGMRFALKHPIEILCDGFFVFYALWSVTWIVGYLLNLAFSALAPAFLAVLPASVLATAFLQASRDTTRPLTKQLEFGETLFLLTSLIAAILLTLFLHRPDPDDEVYLGMAAALLMHAEAPLGSVPGFGAIPSYSPIPGFEANTHALAAYQPLRAMLAYLTGLPLLTSYYLVVPAFMSAMTVLVSYRLLRELVPHAWIPAMLFFFVVMLSWGDAHRTLANFGFVRMFQGKAVLVSVIIPAVLFYFLRRIDSSSKRYDGIMLLAVFVSSLGFSRGGIAITPLLIAILVVASIRVESFSRTTIALGALLLAAGVMMSVLIFQDHWTLNPQQLVHTPRGLVDSTNHAEMLSFTLGEGLRGAFLMACAGLSFFFLDHRGRRYVYRNYLVIFFGLLLIPWTSDFLAKTVFLSMSWRWMWVLPIPILASLAVGAATQMVRRRTSTGDALAVFLVVSTAFVWASPLLVVSEENGTALRFPQPKINGDEIYLEPLQSKGFVMDGRLYLRREEQGY